MQLKALLLILSLSFLKPTIFEVHLNTKNKIHIKVDLKHEGLILPELPLMIEGVVKYYFNNIYLLNQLTNKLNVPEDASLNLKIKFAIIYSLLTEHTMTNKTAYKDITNEKATYCLTPEIKNDNCDPCLICREKEKCIAELVCHPKHRICLECLKKSDFGLHSRKYRCPYFCKTDNQKIIKKYLNIGQFPETSQFLKNTNNLKSLIFKNNEVKLNQTILKALIFGINKDLRCLNTSLKKIMNKTISKQSEIYKSKKRTLEQKELEEAFSRPTKIKKDF